MRNVIYIPVKIFIQRSGFFLYTNTNTYAIYSTEIYENNANST